MVLDKNILKIKPKKRVNTENMVKTATALNKDLMFTPQNFFICLLLKVPKLDKLK